VTVQVMSNVFLRPEDLVDSLQVSFQTLTAWRKKGIGPPFYRFGNTFRYTRDDVERWLSQRYSACGSAAGCDQNEQPAA
jgi:predicted site-specific integrase-resolvase